MLGFIAAAGMSVAILAAVVLLPAWQRCEAARAERDELTSLVATNEALIDYDRRLAEVIRTDPIETQRLLIRQQNYRHPDNIAVLAPGVPEDASPLQMLAARAPSARGVSPSLAVMAARVSSPRARRGLLLVAFVLLICAFVLFLPPTVQPDKK